jgi:outer membrane receptor for ferrienterochelin and colicins
MIKYILPIIAIVFTTNISAQNSFKIIVKDNAKNEILTGVTAFIKSTVNTAISDSSGQIILHKIPNGKQTIVFAFVGFETLEQEFIFPVDDSLQNTVVILSASEEELEEVVVQSTRTSRTIKNTPTRIETIDFEELDEKTNMKPSNVSMLLHESTGIQVQQTSATSGNASIRIQGLDGKYTQLLKNSYPTFGNFASGLSILEIPPLDLKQVEIIKGPASTLYGAGAIAGVVNFISKTPNEKAAYNFIANQSNVGQTNFGGFAMQRIKKMGYSILASYNYQSPYDVDNDGFTELPKSNDFTIHPKLFFYPNEKTTFIIGNSFGKSNRTGGDVKVIDNNADNNHTYFETNNTIRSTTTFDFIQKIKTNEQLVVKSSFSYFNRNIAIPNYSFSGSNYNFFGDISYVKNAANQTIIIGGNYIVDQFSEQKGTSSLNRDFTTKTGGLFAQHTWDIAEKIKLESGLRSDLVNYSNQKFSNTEFFILPRISVLYTFNSFWSSRIGAGLGYKTPTIFTEQTEAFQYQNLLPLNNISSEKSYGTTADINFKTNLGKEVMFSANQMFFYTAINNATVLQQDNLGNSFFSNSGKSVSSIGFETNAKIIYKEDFKFFLGYTFTNAKAAYLPSNQLLPLVPRNKLNLALVYEKEKNFKIGFEGYFTDRQYLYNGNRTPSFWVFGFMAEKTIHTISVFINAENFTDQRQSKYKRVVNAPNNNPTFDDIWNHIEGRTFNGGIKIKL